MDLGIVNHASLGPESGSFRAIHRPEPSRVEIAHRFAEPRRKRWAVPALPDCMFIENWRGHTLVSHEVIVNLIASTTTSKGLRVRAALDTRKYPTGIHVNDTNMASLNLVPDNYPLVPFGSNQSNK